MHSEAVRPTKLVRGSGATGSHQVLPRGLAEPCASKWASLGMLGTKTLSSHELACLARMWAKSPDPSNPFASSNGTVAAAWGLPVHSQLVDED
ncbi:hypothetical protein DP73_01405 [Desulfosporosinus sp. HMP52]|nr:hypothetical protein DP73_01405 [Desulfosporosinus sp. HMP52]